MIQELIISFGILVLVSCSGQIKSTSHLASAVNVNPIQPVFGTRNLNTPDSRLRMVARTQVASTLRQIFGSDTAQSTIIDQLISVQFAGMGGGPCDPYASIPTIGSEDACTFGGLSQLPAVPGYNSIRGALVTRACNLLTVNDPAILNAVALSNPSVNPRQVLPADTDLVAVFSLFFPGQIPSEEILDAMRKIISSVKSINGTALDAWRFVLLTLCMSPGWQIS